MEVTACICMQAQPCSRQNHITNVIAKSTVSQSSLATGKKRLSAAPGYVEHANPAAIPCMAETDESLLEAIKFRIQLASVRHASLDQIIQILERSNFICLAWRQSTGKSQDRVKVSKPPGKQCRSCQPREIS